MKSLTGEIDSENPPRNWKHRHKIHWNSLRDLVLFAVTCIFCLVTGLFGTIVSTPSNIAVLKGQEVAFRCTTNTTDKLLWSILLPGATSDVLVFDGFNVNIMICFCSVQFANQESTLQFTANESSAARYTCAEMYFGARAIVQLIVLESDPVCSDNSTDDVVFLTCRVTFSGHWSPVVEWMQIADPEEKEITDGVETMYTLAPSKRIVTLTSILLVLANRSSTAYKCTVKFSSSNKPRETTAENVPSYNFSWMWSSEKYGGINSATAPEKLAVNLAVVLGTVLPIIVLIAIVVVVIFVWKRKQSPGHMVVQDAEECQFSKI